VRGRREQILTFNLKHFQNIAPKNIVSQISGREVFLNLNHQETTGQSSSSGIILENGLRKATCRYQVLLDRGWTLRGFPARGVLDWMSSV
jgi:hypothetical protein